MPATDTRSLADIDIVFRTHCHGLTIGGRYTAKVLAMPTMVTYLVRSVAEKGMVERLPRFPYVCLRGPEAPLLRRPFIIVPML